MNRFEFLKEIDDLGVTTVENAFINHYMPKARGDYVKVYLYGLKCCYTGHSVFPSNQEIATTLHLTEKDVQDAWKYWAKEGILNLSEEGQDYIIDYKMISSHLFFKENTKRKQKPMRESGKIRQMYKDIEEKLGRLLTHTEMDMFLNWIDEYKFTPQTIFLLIADCIDREKRSKSYWESMATVFYDNKVKTYDQAQQFLQARDQRWKVYKEILNYLGFFRLQTKPEEAMMKKWLDEYQYDMNTIKKACDETVATNKPSIRYVDSILTAWHNGEPVQKPRKSPKIQKRTPEENKHNYDEKALERALFGDE